MMMSLSGFNNLLLSLPGKTTWDYSAFGKVQKELELEIALKCWGFAV